MYFNNFWRMCIRWPNGEKLTDTVKATLRYILHLKLHSLYSLRHCHYPLPHSNLQISRSHNSRTFFSSMMPFYFTNRFASTGSCCSCARIKCLALSWWWSDGGVRRSSVIGPILFLLCISDLLDLLFKISYMLHVRIFSTHATFVELKHSLHLAWG